MEVEDLLERANSLYDRGDRYEDAILLYDFVLEMNPKQKEAHLEKAAALENLGKYEEALVQYELLQDIDPNLIDTTSGKVGCFLELGRLEEALQESCNCLRLDSEQDTAYPMLAEVHKLLGEHDKALEWSRIALDRDPLSLVAQVVKGEILELRQHWDEALFIYDYVITVHGDIEAVHTHRANVLLKKREYELSLEAFDKAKKVFSSHISPCLKYSQRDCMSPYAGKAYVLANAFEKYEEALDVCNEGLQAMPQAASELHFYEGCIHAKLYCYADALRSFDKSLYSDPDDTLGAQHEKQRLCQCEKSVP